MPPMVRERSQHPLKAIEVGPPTRALCPQALVLGISIYRERCLLAHLNRPGSASPNPKGGSDAI